MNFEYISFSMREGIEELEKIANLSDKKILTEEEFKARVYAILLDVFRGYNLRNSKMKLEDFDTADQLPIEIMELFENDGQ